MTEDRSKLYARIWEEAHADLGITSVAATKGEPPCPPAPLVCAALDRARAEGERAGYARAVAAMREWAQFVHDEWPNLSGVDELSAQAIEETARHVEDRRHPYSSDQPAFHRPTGGSDSNG